MQERLAWVAGRVVAALSRRSGDASRQGLAEIITKDYKRTRAFGKEAFPRELDDRISEIADIFRLDRMAQQLLSVAVAGEFDMNLALAYDLLSGRTGVGVPTVSSALELCGIGTADVAGFTALGLESPLVKSRLLRVSGSGVRLYRSVQATDRVVRFLSGDNDPDPAVAHAQIDPVPYACDAASQIARAVQDGAMLVWVHSPLGTAGVAAAAGAFAEIGVGALAVDLRRVNDTAARAELIAEAARESALVGCALILLGGETIAEPREIDALLNPVVPIVAVGHGYWNPTWSRFPPLTIDAPVITGSDRDKLWSLAVGSLPNGQGGQLPISSLRLTPEEILAAARYARKLAEARDEELTQQTIRDTVRTLAAGQSNGRGIQHRRPGSVPAGFDDLVLPERTIADIRRLVSWAANRDDVIARGPVHGKGGKGIGIAALFTGNPGTGKTMAANVIADELNLELMQVDLSSIVDKYIGETEKNLERVFHEAESRNVVLFFDEADAIFGKRSEVKDARDRYANQEVAYLLQRVEKFDGITIMATNLRGNLDTAFSRRMQFVIHFPDPDAPTRLLLWKQHLANAGVLDEADPVDLELLSSTVELAGGDIRNVVLAATYDAVAADQGIGMRHIRVAAIREFTKLGRLAPPSLTEKAFAED